MSPVEAAYREHKAGRSERAEAMCRKTLEADPDNPRGLFALAEIVGALDRADEAVALLEKTAALKPRDARIQSAVAGAYRALGRAREAEESYGRVLALTPRDTATHNNLGTLLAGQGRHDQAKACYERALAIKPDLPEALNNFGNSLRAQGKLDEALTSYRRAIAARPKYARAHSNLGDTLRELGQADDAEAECRAAIKLEPKLAEAHNNLGNALRKQRRLDEAEAAYRRAVRLNPRYVLALTNLGFVLGLQNKKDASREAFEKVLEIDPDNGVAAFSRDTLRGETPESAPREYVEQLFDQYAESFDRHLVDHLEYRTPDLLRELLVESMAGRIFENGLDLGCGTGLSGVALRDLVKSLSGVDLSRRMIEEAEKKKVYDALHVADLEEFLEQSGRRYDLFVAADVFVYIGDLSGIFAAVRANAASGAAFAFSVEASDEEGYVLRGSERYAHGTDYVLSLASEHGFRVLERTRVELRKERGAGVPGDLYVLERGDDLGRQA